MRTAHSTASTADRMPMPTESAKPFLRLVLDTNVWLDWLVFADPDIAAIREGVAARRIEIVIDAPCEAELVRVLEYRFGRRTLDDSMKLSCLVECHRLARRTEAALSELRRMQLPRCRDPDDQKFVELALAANADHLITRDRALLEMSHRCDPSRRAPALAITTPKQFPARAMQRHSNALGSAQEAPTL